MSKLKWFVRLGKVFPESPKRWEVMRGGFRDSIHISKWHAEYRRDQLNNADKND